MLYEYSRPGQRSIAAMRQRGCTPSGYTFWTPREEKIVIDLWPDHKAIRAILKHRSLAAVRMRASVLNLPRVNRVWTGAEVLRLRKVYAFAPWADLLRVFPGRTRKSISYMAERTRLSRKRPELALTGHRLVDSIRARARRCNITMRELDQIVRARFFITRDRCKGAAPNPKIIFRAVEALDGEIRIEWRD